MNRIGPPGRRSFSARGVYTPRIGLWAAVLILAWQAGPAGDSLWADESRAQAGGLTFSPAQPSPVEPTTRYITPRGTAATGAAPRKTTAGSRTRPTSSSTTVAAALLGILGLITGVALVVKRFLPRRGAGLPSEVLQVLGQRRLDARHTIHLVRCGGKVLVLGSSAGGLTPLTEIVDPIEVDTISGLCQPRVRTESAHLFGQLLQKFSGPEPPAPGPGIADPAAARLRERLHQTSESQALAGGAA